MKTNGCEANGTGRHGQTEKNPLLDVDVDVD